MLFQWLLVPTSSGVNNFFEEFRRQNSVGKIFLLPGYKVIKVTG